MTNGLPRGWSWLRLDQLAASEPGSITDGPFGSNLKTADYVVNGEARVIRLGNIGIGELVDKNKSFVSAEKFQALAKHEARANDLVVAALAEPVGRCMEVPEHLGRALVKADCIRVRVNPAFDRHYVMWALNSPEGRRRAEAAAHGTGRLRINLSDLRSLLVPTAPANEQRRIVAKLETLQTRSRRAREALEAVPPLLEKLRQSILAAAFRGDLTKDWRAQHPDVEPASELLKRIRVERRKKWEEAELAKMKAKGKAPTDDRWKARYKEPEPVDATGLPELPGGWCWAGLSELAELQLGQRRAPEYAHEAHFPYVRAANITWRGLDLSDVKTMGIADPESLFLEAGDVILNEASGSPGEVGKPALWRGEIPRCCFQATVLRVRASSGPAGGEWLHGVFLRDAMLGNFARMAPGVGILHLTAERMRSWPIPLAPVGEQRRIIERVESVLSRIASMQDVGATYKASLLAIEQSILAKAFRGELVPQDPNDEPAEAMLARLRGEKGAAPVEGEAARGSARGGRVAKGAASRLGGR